MSSTAPMTESAALEAALTRLRAVHSAAAGRAEQALDVVLAGTRRSIWPEVAWRSSGLTNTGCPVEFSWSSRDSAIRWTAEAAGPEIPESGRLGAVLAGLDRLGVTAHVPEWLTPRPDRKLRFGAWLGGRHDGSGDRYKLYVDLAAATAPRDLPGAALRAIPSRVVWRMAGVDCGGEVSELYGRWAKPKVWEIERLLTCCGLSAAPLVEMAVQLSGMMSDDLLLPGTAGLSLAIAQDRVAACGCFVHAGPLLGGDRAVARAIRRLTGRYDWDAAIYEALLGTAPPGRPGRHGMIGFGVTAVGDPWLQIGLRP